MIMDTNSNYWCEEGHFNKDQADFIIELIKQNNPNYIIEIGFCTGRSSFSVLFNNTNIKKFISIDIDLDYMKPHGRIMAEKLKNQFNVFNIIESSSHNILTDSFIINEFPNGIDFAIVDGDHSYDGCLNDLNNIYKYINKNGIIIVDDYKSGLPNGCYIKSVIDACDDFHKKHQYFIKTEWYCNGKGFCIFKNK